MEDLKRRTARAMKWNAVDRLSSQVLYAVTGIVLARELSPDDFGLVGAILIFQSFASLLVDSGFSYALIQRKEPTREDYSSVLWFNLGMALFLYIILYICAPLIAACFGGDQRLIPMSRVMLVTFVLNASSIVQVNRLTKQMHVRPVAIANAVSLAAGGAVGIALAFSGYGAWAIIWQSIANSGLKSAILWCTCHWWPEMRCSWRAIKSFLGIGASMMLTSLLNTIFLNIYSFFIGNRAGLASLGYYTQSDKWSKMGIMSLQQTLTSTFLPTLSAVQDEAERYRRLCSKMNRMTAYLLFPAMIGLAVTAAAIFHTLFGEKWDASIPLFQLLLVRGIFTVLSGIYNNYILSIGKSKRIVMLEAVRDGVALVALLITLPYIAMETQGDVVYGIKIMLYGQVAAAVLGWAVTLITACRATGAKTLTYLHDLAPYLVLTLIAALPAVWISGLGLAAPLTLALQLLAAGAVYIGLNALLGSQIQKDIFGFLMGSKKNHDLP